MLRSRVVVLLLAGALASVGAGCQRGAAAGDTPGEGRVAKVVDGDTLHVEIGGVDERVRFIGIDTPETHGQGGLRECFGQEATKRLTSLTPVGTRVRLVRDAEARDRYGRLLAYVYRLSDDLFVNLSMARDGYADVLTYPPNVAHAEEFVAAVASARRADKGLWRACGSADVPL